MLAAVVDDGGGLKRGNEEQGGGGVGVRQHFTGAAAALVGLWRRDVSRNVCIFLRAFVVSFWLVCRRRAIIIRTTTTITNTHQNHDVYLMHISFDRRQHVAGVLVNSLPRYS
jgi:hypothetical protein